jgi:hypothetical protein
VLLPVHPMLFLAIDMQSDVRLFADLGHQSRRGRKAVGHHTANVSVIVFINLSDCLYILLFYHVII